MTVAEFLLGALASFGANFFSALAGGGSGLFLLPALLLLGLPFPAALATHKIATVGLGIGASSRHWQEQAVKPRFCLYLLAVGGPGVVLGAHVAVSISEQVASFALGILILSLALFTHRLKQSSAPRSQPRLASRVHWLIGGVGVFVIGLLNGSLTSGTGLFFTFWLVSWFQLSFTEALSYAMIICSLGYNLLGAVVLGMQVTVDWVFITALLVGAVLGGYAGSSLSLSKGNKFVRFVFTVSCLAVGSSLLIVALEPLLTRN